MINRFALWLILLQVCKFWLIESTTAFYFEISHRFASFLKSFFYFIFLTDESEMHFVYVCVV